MACGRIDVMKKREGRRPRKALNRFFRYVIPVMHLFSFLLVVCMIFPPQSMGNVSGDTEGRLPLWWPDAQKRAEAAGFGLIGFPKLQALLKSPNKMILLDVRPDYEYTDGHIPGALNFEFHLGHRSRLAPERAKALKVLLGPDRNRLVVTYCRNFR
jgi:phage shock protein E